MKQKNPVTGKKLKKLLKNKVVLVTGGAGSIGSHLTKKLLKYPIKSVRVLDSNEHALFVLKRSIKDQRVRFLLGNILDKDRIDMAGNNVDIIIHTAAIKNIEISEFNAIETIDVNVNGTIKLIKMTMRNNPKVFLNVSTDKAVNSSTLYGTTKQLSERLVSWAGTHIMTSNFGTVRFGNVIESKGNVFEIWGEQSKNNKPLSITHPEMKRYFFNIEEAIDCILESLLLIKHGEIIIPKMKLYKIKDLATKISKKSEIIGKRKGEKMEEILMTEDEKKRAIKKNNLWIVKPS